MVTHRPARLATALAASALVLAGCGVLPFGGGTGTGGSDGGASSSASSTDGSASGGSAGGGNGTSDGALPQAGTSHAAGLKTDPAEDQAYASYYGQSIDWQPCADYAGAQCGTLTVPKAWDDPSAGDLELAMVKAPATGQRTGTLFMNPGGPGGSGVSFVGDSATMIVGSDVREKYDMVGFDPRGVAGSSPVRCLDDAQTDEYLSATYDMTTPEGLEEGRTWAKTVADSCAQNSGDLLEYVDTLSAARDMDVMRAAVDSEKLDYLGFSYGTYLGATYADLYPSRAGRMVLDGAIDPTLTGDQIAEGQAGGFEVATERFAAWCVEQGSETCPLKGDATQGVQQIRDFFAATSEQPVATDDPQRPLTGALARSGVLVGLYNDENWPYVAQGLQEAMTGDGALLLQLADMSSERDADGTYASNGNFAITAVNCLDHPAVEDEAWMKEDSARMAQEYPTFGPMLGYNGLTCGAWPAGPLREPAPLDAKGSGPILVVGTTYDPATPYPWAQALAEQLDDGHLITWNGDGHTAYGRSGGCVEDAVDQYLLAGTVPAEGLTCE